MKVCVVSDLHYYDKKLGIKSNDFHKHCRNEVKLLAYSDEIWDSFVESISEMKIDVLLLTGDMTNEGEISSHIILKEKLEKLEDNLKIKIFILPGNHDIDNLDAKCYLEDNKTELVDYLKSNDFAEFYMNYGYSTAHSIDNSSLSYSTVLFDKFFLLAIDTVNYNNRFTKLNKIAGRISNETTKWIEEQLQYAEKMQLFPIVAHHHPLLEHFPEMKLNFSDFIIDNSDEIVNLYHRYNVQLVLSGHHHANSIINNQLGNNTIWDIQTNSMLTWNCTFRILNFQNKQINYNTYSITSIKSNNDFLKYAYDFTYSAISELMESYSKNEWNENFDHNYISLLVETYLAYLSGNRAITNRLLDIYIQIKSEKQKEYFNIIWNSPINHLNGIINVR